MYKMIHRLRHACIKALYIVAIFLSFNLYLTFRLDGLAKVILFALV